MANAMKCDACGKYYDDNQRFVASGRHHGHGGNLTGIATACDCSSDKWFDLCDDCMETVLRFLHEIGGEADGQAHTGTVHRPAG